MVKVYQIYKFEEPLLMLSNRSALQTHAGRLISAANQYIFVSDPGASAPSQILRRSTDSPSNVSCLKVLKDGFLCAGYESGDIVVWNLKDKFEERTLDGHSAGVSSISSSASGAKLLTTSLDNTAVLWDYYSEEVIAKVEAHKGPALDSAFLTSILTQRVVTSGRDGFVKLWSDNLSLLDIFNSGCPQACRIVVTGQLVIVANAKDEITLLSVLDEVGPDGRYFTQVAVLKRNSFARVNCMGLKDRNIYLLTKEKTVEVYKLLDGGEAAKKAKRAVKRAREKGEQQVVAAVVPIVYVETHHLKSKPRALAFGKVPYLALKNQVSTLPPQKPIFPIYPFSELQIQGSYLGGMEGSTFRGYIMGEKLVPQLDVQGVEAFSLIPRTSFCVLVVQEKDGKKIRLYSLRTREVIAQTVWNLKGGLALAEQGGVLKVVGWGGRRVELWFIIKEESGLGFKKQRDMDLQESVTKVRATADGKYHLVGLNDHSVRVLHSDTGRLFLALYGHKLPVLDFCVSSDCTLVATGSVDKDIKIWALDFGNCVRSFFAHEEPVSVVRFIEETHYLLSGGKDGKVKFWDIDQAQLIFVFEEFNGPVSALAVSPCGGFFFVGAADLGLRLFRQSKEQTVFKEQEALRLEKQMLQSTAKEGKAVTHLKHGQQIIEFLLQHSSSQDPNLPGLLDLFGKIPISSLESSLSFLHQAHRAVLREYIRAMVVGRVGTEVAFRVAKAMRLELPELDSLRAMWRREQAICACNIQSIRLIRKRQKESEEWK